MTSQLNVALIRNLSGPSMCLGYYVDVINGCLYNQTLADVRSTGARIKELIVVCNSVFSNLKRVNREQ